MTESEPSRTASLASQFKSGGFFKAKYDFGNLSSSVMAIVEKRRKWACEALKEYPNKFPLIIERAADQDQLDEMQNPK